MAVLADLMLRLRANSADLQTGLDKSKKAMKDAGNSSKELNKTIGDTFKDATRAVDNFIPGFSGLIGGFEKAGTAVKALAGTMKILKVALASTGIGLLVIALGTLASYFMNTEEGGDKFAAVLGRIKGVLGEVMKRVNLLGESITLLLQGKFKEAGEKAKEAFTDLGKAIKAAGAAGDEAADRRDAQEDKEIAFITRQQELLNKIAKAREIYSNGESSVAEKQRAITDAMEAQNELYGTKKEIAQETLDILKLENSTKERTNVEIKAEQEATAAVLAINAEQSSELRGLYKLQKNITKGVGEELIERQKILDILREGELAIQAQAEAMRYVITPEFTPLSQPEWEAQYPDVTKDPNYIASKEAIAQENARRRADNDKTVEEEKIGWSDILEWASSAIDSIGMLQEAAMNRELAAAGDNEEKKDEIRKKYAKKGKATSIAQALINGALGVTKAFAELGPIAGAIGAALIGASTIAQIAVIKSTPFAKGGLVHGPTMGLVGEYAGAKTNPEVIAPLSDLKNILANTLIGGGGQQLVARVAGRDLLFVVEESRRVKNNSY